ncbi:hypothetical protein [Dyella sp. RRB7]|uniref:hypothetical protein n=1 Tax=Dyella sp. RRB7 TaxID=2919502 RepID=UPI001FA9AA6F|nr:hypothetical protein [Dyella sp. RRB7]
MAMPPDPRLMLVPNDVDTYANYAEGIDPARYFDSQARDVWLAAKQRWPLLVAVLQDDSDDPCER